MINRLFRFMRCAITLSRVRLRYRGSAVSRSNSDFLFYALTKEKACSSTALCVAVSSLSSALVDGKPARILEVYRESLRVCPEISLPPSSTTAILEAAVWLKDREAAKSILDRIENGKARVRSKQSLARLEQLFAWRFAENKSEAYKLLSPLTPSDAMILYVDYYARATIAEAIGNSDDALRYYRLALESLPRESEERARAIEACNFILKNKE